MLTDIFARRYANYPIWTQYTENEPRLLQQCIGVAKDVLPYYSFGKVDETQKAKWKSIHDRLARELGLRELWQRFFSTTNNSVVWHHTNEWVTMCEYYTTSPYAPQAHGSVDRYMKERLSLIELVMHERQNEINELNRTLDQRAQNAVADALWRSSRSGRMSPRDFEAEVRSRDAAINEAFNASVNELNVRFQQAGVPLSYHNGFIQVAKDEQIEKQVAEPFWRAIADPKWENVAIDINKALDGRDNGASDAALFACRALESAIKIISDLRGWSRGSEKGAHDYINNLVAERDGVRFIDTFEMEVLKPYFTHVRNKLGHGPGSQPMPNLTVEQTDWAIEFAMTWIRTLVRR
jgi:AbiJ N-terminal domain 4